MPRPIWTGTISFGLLQVPVRLMTGERRTDLHFRLLDSRDNKPVRYERVNSETGEEVPWKQIVKAFEYDKGNYVVVSKKDFKEASPESAESVDVEAFVDLKDIDMRYYEKPYYLVPVKRGEKGYVLLRETLRETGLAGLARVVMRTREHLALVVAEERALMLMMLRYPQELVPQDEYELPEEGKAGMKISAKELDMAKQLVMSMREDWTPEEYHDDYRDKLTKVIERRLQSKDVVESEEAEGKAPEGSATNVVDFMALLKKSIAENKRQPAAQDKEKGKETKKAAAKGKSSSSTGKKSARKTAKKKSASKRTTKKTAASKTSAKSGRRAG